MKCHCYIVMGISSSGKSTIASALSKILKVPFLEGDSFHASQSLSKMQNGIPLNDSDRLPWLEKLSLIIQEYHEQNQSIFLSCSALKQHYREILKGKLEVDGEPFVRFIWLDIDSDLAQERCRARATHFFPTSLIESQILTLDMTPAECFCHVQVTREKSQTEILREILDEII